MNEGAQLRYEAGLEGLGDLDRGEPSDVLESALAAAREYLGLDVAFVGKLCGERLSFRALEGEAGSFGFEKNVGIPYEGSYCKRLIEGRIPQVIEDAKEDERVRDLRVTREADIGSYVGIPLRFSDGEVHGTFCCLGHAADPTLRERDLGLLKFLARLVAEQLEREELQRKNRRLEARAAGVDALVATLEARDAYTSGHSKSVTSLAFSVARKLGLRGEEADEVELVALLHDVGKIGVPDRVLDKPGPLDDEEWEMMREHPKVGARIIGSTEGLSHLAPAVEAEHERWDGNGYPNGLRGNEIPLASRIVLACDAFHAITSDRPYRKARGKQEALRELEKGSGTQFDPLVVTALIEVVQHVSVEAEEAPHGNWPNRHP